MASPAKCPVRACCVYRMVIAVVVVAMLVALAVTLAATANPGLLSTAKWGVHIGLSALVGFALLTTLPALEERCHAGS